MSDEAADFAPLPLHHMEPPVVVALNVALVLREHLTISLLYAAVDREGFEVDSIALRDAAKTRERAWPDGGDFMEPHDGSTSDIPAWRFSWDEPSVTLPLGDDFDLDAIAATSTSGGGGHESLWRHAFRLRPVPTAGDVIVYLSWPAWDIECSATLDGDALRRAQRKSRDTRAASHQLAAANDASDVLDQPTLKRST